MLKNVNSGFLVTNPSGRTLSHITTINISNFNQLLRCASPITFYTQYVLTYEGKRYLLQRASFDSISTFQEYCYFLRNYIDHMYIHPQDAHLFSVTIDNITGQIILDYPTLSNAWKRYCTEWQSDAHPLLQ